MMPGLSSSRIPWLAACEGVRWNCISGCDNPASVCAVRNTAQGCWAATGAGAQGRAFAPAFHPECLDAPRRLRFPRVIGVALGGDLWSPGIDPDWRRQVATVEELCFYEGCGHVFVHLTKNPDAIKPGFARLDNQWMGVSVTDDRAHDLIETLDDQCLPYVHRWVSFEPVLSAVQPMGTWESLADWLRAAGVKFVVLGGLTDGQRHIVPPHEPGGLRVEWAQTIITAGCAAGIPIFCKGLHGAVWPRLVNPLTGERFWAATELRQLPPEWIAIRRSKR